MKSKTIILIIFLEVFLLQKLNAQDDKYKEFTFLPNGDLLLEDFEQEAVGDLPEYWFNRDGERKPKFYDEDSKSKYMYRIVEENNNKFLRYEGSEGKHINLPLKVSKKVDLDDFPVLSWRWRALTLPKGGNEDEKKKNDVALSVYVVFKVTGLFKLPKSIRYTWSTTLPKGKVLTKFGGRQKVVVLESGEKNLNQWLIVERNLKADYRKYFNEDPPDHPLGLLILSDADDTKDFAMGDYDDFKLKRIQNNSR